MVLNFQKPFRNADYRKFDLKGVIQIAHKFDLEGNLARQVHEVFEELPLTQSEWKNERVRVALPFRDALVPFVLMELFERTGRYPDIIEREIVGGKLRVTSIYLIDAEQKYPSGDPG